MFCTAKIHPCVTVTDYALSTKHYALTTNH